MIYEFMATQSFNGYDKPWAPGAGINLFDPSPLALIAGVVVNPDERVYLARNNPLLSQVIWDNQDLEEGQFAFTYKYKYAVGTGSSGAFPVINYTDETSHYLNSTVSSSWAVQELVSHPTKTVKNVTMSFGTGTNSTDFYLQIIKGDTAADWTPYANICMPEGFNIWDPTTQKYVQVYAGYVNANTRELYLRPVYEEYAGEELVGPWMSSLDPYSEDATPTEGAFVIDFGGELTEYEITPFMLQTLLDSLGIRQHFTDGAGLLNSLMDQAQGRVRSEAELLNRSLPLKVIAIGDQLPTGLTFKPISKDVLPGLPGKFIR